MRQQRLKVITNINVEKSEFCTLPNQHYQSVDSEKYRTEGKKRRILDELYMIIQILEGAKLKGIQ